jgi:hypothetical protein
MATNKPSSLSAFHAYCKEKENNLFQNALRESYKVNAKKLGYPSKDEIGIVDNAVMDGSHIAEVIPTLISNYMHDEKRAFDLPAPDKKTAPATIKVVAVPEKTKTGTVMLGDKKGQTYTSTVKAHEEYKVKSRTKDFKK